MALESKLSVLQSIDDNEFISSGESANQLRNNNGANGVEDVVNNNNNNGTGVVSPSVTVEGNKRHGLRKWRRIPRELARKTGSDNNNLNNNKGNGDVSPAVRQEMLNVVNGDSDGSSSGSSAEASPPRTRIGSEKKARGGSVMGIMGSDSGRSGFVFVQGGNTVASEGRPSDTIAKHDEESSDHADNIKKHEGSMERDPLVESINGLHSAQEEFEKEVQKWRDVGKDDSLIVDDPMREILELKDAKILELEHALSSGGIKTEFEDSLMKMIEADVENVVITATSKGLTEGLLREIKHSLQQKSVPSRDVQATKKQDGKLETEESLKKVQSRVCIFTSCFVIQLILLLVTLYLKFSPQNVEVVPT